MLERNSPSNAAGKAVCISVTSRIEDWAPGHLNTPEQLSLNAFSFM
jgi:hypothetical protein